MSRPVLAVLAPVTLLLSPVLLSGAPLVATAQPAPAAAAPKPGSQWSQYPRMQLERTYAGPLQDTIVERWRDPIDGAVCYLYLPVTAQHSAPLPSGFVQYGANTIGSISCVAAPPRPPAR